MRTLFTRFYRREAISRCIGLVRRIKIIFLPTRCRGFWLTSVVRAPGSAQKRHLRRLSIDFCRIRAPMRRHRKMACFPHFSPHDRSKKGNAIGKQSTHSIHTKRSLSECSMDHPSTARSEEHWDRTFMVSVDTRRRRSKWRFSAPPGALTPEVSQNLDI